MTRLALIAVLMAAASLAACGRKGPLDPPPSTRLTEPTDHGAAAAKTADGKTADTKTAEATGDGGPTAALMGSKPKGKEPPPAMDQYGHPLAGHGEKKPFILDFLLN
jgi:predicted small lipoprotein YifL